MYPVHGDYRRSVVREHFLTRCQSQFAEKNNWAVVDPMFFEKNMDQRAAALDSLRVYFDPTIPHFFV
jgi:hypothetical protein